MALMMQLRCDHEGCEKSLSATFNPANTITLQDAARSRGWGISPMYSRHFCPAHKESAGAQ